MSQKRSAVESLVEYTCKGLMCNLHVFSTQHIGKLFSFEVICFITPITVDSILMNKRISKTIQYHTSD